MWDYSPWAVQLTTSGISCNPSEVISISTRRPEGHDSDPETTSDKQLQSGGGSLSYQVIPFEGAVFGFIVISVFMGHLPSLLHCMAVSIH